MRGILTARAIVVCVLSVYASACRKKVAAPPPVAPTIVLPTPQPPKEAPLPPAPKVESKEPPENPPIPEKEVQAPPPKKRPSPPRKKSPPPKKSVPEPKVDPKPDPEPPVAQPPRFGQILTEEKTKEFTKRLDAATERVRQALGVIQGKTLTEEQRDATNRIRVFLTQAEQAREQDLQNAVSLAERADLLSRDLLDRLR